MKAFSRAAMAAALLLLALPLAACNEQTIVDDIGIGLRITCIVGTDVVPVILGPAKPGTLAAKANAYSSASAAKACAAQGGVPSQATTAAAKG